MKILTRPLTNDEAKALIKDDRLEVVIKMPFYQIACSSEDGSYDGMNDYADHYIVGGDFYLGDLSYSVVGHEPATEAEPSGFVLVQVNAEVDFDEDN